MAVRKVLGKRVALDGMRGDPSQCRILTRRILAGNGLDLKLQGLIQR